MSTNTSVNANTNKTMDPFQEILDDPTIPFSKRWEIIKEIDRTNTWFFIFRVFMYQWNKCFASLLKPKNGPYKVMEIGPGSGSLGLKILNWAQNRNLKFQYHLFDSQEDVLNECYKNYKDFPDTKKIKASNNYFKDFADNSIDICVSLHVIHHIHPKAIVLEAFEQMFRISSTAIFIFDFEKQTKFLFWFRFINILIGSSNDITEDGLKSIMRAYPIKELEPELRALGEKYGFEVKIKKFYLFPYWLIFAYKKTT